jgi:UBA/TS-N domain
MGFSSSVASDALVRFHNNLEIAMNYLLEGGEISYPSDILIESESSD